MVITTTKARLNLSIDSELKQEVGEVLNEIGLDYTTAINLYFNKIRYQVRKSRDACRRGSSR